MTHSYTRNENFNINTKWGTLLVGTSGYQYNYWREVFYPSALPKQEWFTYYAEHLDGVCGAERG
jgi:hypothetical protein